MMYSVYYTYCYGVLRNSYEKVLRNSCEKPAKGELNFVNFLSTVFSAKCTRKSEVKVFRSASCGKRNLLIIPILLLHMILYKAAAEGSSLSVWQTDNERRTSVPQEKDCEGERSSYKLKQ